MPEVLQGVQHLYGCALTHSMLGSGMERGGGLVPLLSTCFHGYGGAKAEFHLCGFVIRVSWQLERC